MKKQFLVYISLLLASQQNTILTNYIQEEPTSYYSGCNACNVTESCETSPCRPCKKERCCRGWAPGPRWRFCPTGRVRLGRNKPCCYPKIRCCQPACAPAAEVVAPFDDYRYQGKANPTALDNNPATTQAYPADPALNPAIPANNAMVPTPPNR